jgi:hypothetical protein
MNTQGIRPIDVNRLLVVGKDTSEAVRDDFHVYVRGINHSEALSLVTDFNRGHYPEVCRWMQHNKNKLSGYGISLWMGMIDYIKGSVAAVAAVNPTFQNNANPNGGKPVPKGYQGGHLDPNITDGSVKKRHSTKPVQMWKVIATNPNTGGGKTLLWTDRERLADDLVQLINTRDFQATWDFMDWVKQNIPLVGFGQAGTHLMPSFQEFMDILEHEMHNAAGRAASAALFATPPIGRIPADDQVVEEMEAILELDTYGIGQPNRKSTKEWEPDTPDPDVDLMKSIRDACTR